MKHELLKVKTVLINPINYMVMKSKISKIIKFFIFIYIQNFMKSFTKNLLLVPFLISLLYLTLNLKIYLFNILDFIGCDFQTKDSNDIEIYKKFFKELMME